MNQDDDTKTGAPEGETEPTPVVNPPGSTVKLYRKDSEPVEVALNSESHRIYLGRGFSEEEPKDEKVEGTADAGGSSAGGESTPAA